VLTLIAQLVDVFCAQFTSYPQWGCNDRYTHFGGVRTKVAAGVSWLVSLRPSLPELKSRADFMLGCEHARLAIGRRLFVRTLGGRCGGGDI
jgi:hypothetical protein